MPPFMSQPPLIRALHADDDLLRITDLIHAAYAPHATLGLSYWGTRQSVHDTAQRFAAGLGLIAISEGEYLGTITLRPPQAQSPLALYREVGTWTIGQFAVAPHCKGIGLGKALHQAAIVLARQQGARFIALDTAAPAQALIAMYLSWGYQQVGVHSWRPHTNYDSVVMLRPVDR
jgi:predicted N-acetyltransferase YhbS